LTSILFVGGVSGPLQRERYPSPLTTTEVPMSTEPESLRGKMTRQGEETIGKLAQELLDNPLISGAITRAFEAREKAVQAQEVAMGALNIPSAADLERLTRRVRSVSQRLEGIEDGVDRLDERLASLKGMAAIDERLTHMESSLDKIAKELTAIHKALPGTTKPVSRNQERLKVTEG